LGTLSAEEALERLLVLLDTMAESDETDASSFRTNPILISKMAPPCTPPVSKAH
jgi:hypothetical protein